MISINIEQLVEANITWDQFIFCKYCESKAIETLDAYTDKFGKTYSKESIDDLITKGFLELSEPNKYSWNSINTTTHFKKFFRGTKVKSIVKSLDWLEEWYELFPKGVKAGGYPVRSGLTSCLPKMVAFIKKTNYSQDIIIKATEYYLSELKKVDYNYIQLAKYFIEKNGNSTLESYCELITEKIEAGVDIDTSSTDKFTTSLNG